MDFQIFREMESVFSEIAEHLAPDSRPYVQTLVDRLHELIGFEECAFAFDHKPHKRSLEGFARYLENLGYGTPGPGAVYSEVSRAVQSQQLQGECLRLCRRIREMLEAE